MIRLTKGSSNTIYTYDGFNRLIEAALPDGQTLYNEYDAFGLRISMYENGVNYQFTLDGDNVIAENLGQIDETRHIRGISLIARKDNADHLAYYLHNAHGDVTNLVDGTGLVLNSYTYDAFGDTLTYAETIANRFRYAGEQFDKVTGQYYLRARHYQPSIGRFVQEDTYRGEIGNPQSLNLYAYVTNNPVAMGRVSTLEYKIKTSSGKCIWADIVSGNDVWEVKPVGTDGLSQLKKYVVEGNLFAGPMLSPIEDIPIVDDIKMGIIFPQAGLANYYFYRYDAQGELVIVPSTEAEKAYKKKALQAAEAGVITAGTLALDALTAGASTADDIPSLIFALKLAEDILMQY